MVTTLHLFSSHNAKYCGPNLKSEGCIPNNFVSVSGWVSVIVMWNYLFHSQGIPSLSGLKLVLAAYWGIVLTQPVNLMNLHCTCIFTFLILINYHNCFSLITCSVTIDQITWWYSFYTVQRPHANDMFQPKCFQMSVVH